MTLFSNTVTLGAYQCTYICQDPQSEALHQLWILGHDVSVWVHQLYRCALLGRLCIRGGGRAGTLYLPLSSAVNLKLLFKKRSLFKRDSLGKKKKRDSLVQVCGF